MNDLKRHQRFDWKFYKTFWWKYDKNGFISTWFYRLGSLGQFLLHFLKLSIKTYLSFSTTLCHLETFCFLVWHGVFLIPKPPTYHCFLPFPRQPDKSRENSQTMISLSVVTDVISRRCRAYSILSCLCYKLSQEILAIRMLEKPSMKKKISVTAVQNCFRWHTGGSVIRHLRVLICFRQWFHSVLLLKWYLNV